MRGDRDEMNANEAGQTAQLRAVADLGRLASEDSLNAVMIEAVRLVCTTVGTECCGVFEYQLEETKLHLRWGIGWQPETLNRRTISAAPVTLGGRAIQSTAPVVVTECANDVRFDCPGLLMDHDISSGVSVPLGSADAPWGVLGAYSTAERQFSDRDVDFIVAIGNTLAAAVDRQAQCDASATRKDELASTERIAELNRSMTTALVDGASLAELEQLICDHLVGDQFPTAIIGHFRPKQETAMLRAATDVTDSYGAAVAAIQPSEFKTGLGGHVRETGETQIVDDVREDPRIPQAVQDWAEQHEVWSVIAVPIWYRTLCYGLVICWSTATNGFSTRQEQLLTEMGKTLGSVTHGINSQQFVVADRVVELTFERDDDSQSPFETALAATTVEVEEIIQQADNTVFCYLTLTAGDPDLLVEAAASDCGIQSARHLTTTPDHSVLELVFADDSIFAAVIMVAGQIEHASREEGRSRIRALFQPTVDVRWVVETIQKYHPSWELAAKAYRDKPKQTAFDTRLRAGQSRLTERQAAVLQTAFRAGYFEWPRHSTAEDVADSLGISPPTFHKHIRTCQQKLVGSLFTERLSAS